MLPLHEPLLAVSLPAGLAVAGTLTVAHLVGFPGSRPGGADGPDGVAQAHGPSGDGEWYDEAADLASEVGRTVSGLDRPAEPDLVSRRLLPLSARIRGHVRSAPPTVDEDTYRSFYELAVGCQQVALEHRPRERAAPGVEDRLESLGTAATRVEERVVAAG